MVSFEFEGRRPVVAPDVFVAATATLIGEVTVEAGASVWYGAAPHGRHCAVIAARRIAG
jgi:carbonic anhydrase/acetyltransferase-like protein (isoleucine patch superfamily)